jgi:hypothetical protein
VPVPIAIAYTAAWILACAGAVALVVRAPDRFALLRRAYWRALLVPWKLATFALATSALAIAAPYTGDPTWDWVDALFMAALTYATAPWALGVLWSVARRRLARSQAYVAACAWLFTASWSYDASMRPTRAGPSAGTVSPCARFSATQAATRSRAAASAPSMPGPCVVRSSAGTCA